jgi:rubrerythrin
MKQEAILKLKEQFKSEIAAFNGYEAIIDMIEDEYLEKALEEIMYDEFLHAKFLRSYMMKEGVYDPNQHIECEKGYKKMMEN